MTTASFPTIPHEGQSDGLQARAPVPVRHAPPAHAIARADRADASEFPLAQRLDWVRRFRAGVAASADNLVRLTSAETGKTEWEAFSADVLPLLAACKWHERHAARVLRDRPALGAPFWLRAPRIRVRRAPLGHVAIIATWNYPVQLLGVQVVQAIVAGNRVSVKPSEHAPRTQSLLMDLALAAGLPPDWLHVHPATRPAGPLMLASGRFDHIVFTGSTGVGLTIARHAAQHLTPSTLELSGRDSALVLADADPELAARSIWSGVTMNAGQTCMAPRRALVHDQVYEQFLAALAPLAAAARPLALINESAAQHAYEQARSALDAGGRSLSGVAEPPVGRCLRPLAIVDCPPEAPLVAGDHFAPVLAVVRVRNDDHALSIHRACAQHLATSIFTRTPARARAIAPRLAAASVTINDCIVPTAHPGVGITGLGLSGWGPSRGPEGLLAMTRPLHESTTGSLFRLPSDPPPPHLARRIQRCLLWWYAGSAPRKPLSRTEA